METAKNYKTIRLRMVWIGKVLQTIRALHNMEKTIRNRLNNYKNIHLRMVWID